MSSFYLDIIKDRQYTMATDSLGRRSAQTAMYMITDALVRWIAPVLSFTADEIWQHLREQSQSDKDTRASTVFTTTYLESLFALGDNESVSAADWQVISEVRDAASKSMETLRSSGDIGGSLEASVTVFASSEVASSLGKLGDELRFVFITSTAQVLPLEQKPVDSVVLSVAGHEFSISTTKASGSKCVRCWHLREDVGQDTDHPEICLRCISNVHGSGEQRAIA